VDGVTDPHTHALTIHDEGQGFIQGTADAIPLKQK
jgi:hypothetical protein